MGVDQEVEVLCLVEVLVVRDKEVSCLALVEVVHGILEEVAHHAYEVEVVHACACVEEVREVHHVEVHHDAEVHQEFPDVLQADDFLEAVVL